MTANRTQNAALDQQLILELRIDASGEVTRKPTKLGRKDTLEGKLLGQLYPGIRVARVSVPYELTPYEQSVVENRMASVHYGGVEYKLVGASGSAKDGKFYFVDKAHAGPIAERFQHWPEAAIVYFAILVSDCKLMVEEPDLRIAVVKDHVLGTNDCRGWARESLYRKLKIGTNRFCQFRLAFDASETSSPQYLPWQNLRAPRGLCLVEYAAGIGRTVCSHHRSLTDRGPALFDRRRNFDHSSGSTGNALTHIEDDQIRVNVIPQKLKDGENAALTTPVTVTGTAEELDRDLPATLVNFVSAHLELKNTLERAKSEMEAAAKTAQAEARAKSKTTATRVAPKAEPAKVAETPKSTPQKPAEPARAASLFDVPASEATPAPVSDEEEEIPPQADEEDVDSNEDDFDEAA